MNLHVRKSSASIESTEKVSQPTQKREVKHAEKHEKSIACQPVVEPNSFQKTHCSVKEFDTPTTMKSWYDRKETEINSGILGDFKTSSRLADMKQSRFSYMLAQPGENKNDYSS